MNHPNQVNIDFAKGLAIYSWEELLTMHDFYNQAASANKQAYEFCVLIERELTNRAIKGADVAMKAYGND